MFKKYIYIIFGMVFLLGGCGVSHDIKDFAGKTPTMDFQEYFTGPIKAWGIVQGPFGKIKRQFTADLNGSWDGESGVLDETFQFDNGETMERQWNITRHSENTYTATADDIIGTASGESAGNAINWNYTMDLPVKDTSYNITFDDWMFLMEDDVIVNKAKMSKFGIKVGEMTIFMQKQ